ncbi:MAG: DHHA1 domain-containing protein, partial [Turicibacter sp.]
FHLGKDRCTIDIDIPLTQNQLQEVEQMANQVIFNRIPVEILYPSKAELKKLSLKDLPKGKGEIRIVRIPELDVNPCGGVHPATTVEVQGIKISRTEKNRQNTRVEFLAGSRIMNDYLNKASFSNTICQTLNCNEQTALQKIDAVVQELKQLTSLTTKLNQDVLDYQVQDYLENAIICKQVRIVNLVFDNQDVKQISTLATKLTSFDHVVAILATTQEDSANLIFKCSPNLKKLNMSNLLKDSISLINGRGGGSATSAQGGGKNNNNLVSALEYACNQVQKTI